MGSTTTPATPGPQRNTPRKPKKSLYPAAIEREYVRFVQASATRVIDAVERFVVPALATGRSDDLAHPPEDDRWYTALELAFKEALAAALVSPESLRAVIALFGSRVNAFNARQFHELLRAAYGVDIFRAEPVLEQLMRVWEAENLRLIQSVPTQYLDQLQGRVVAAVQRGETLRSLTAYVRSTYDLPTNRAELIARDQIGKLNGRLTGYRQRNIGISEYNWRGVLDTRERDEHVAREGQTFAWDKPPPDGHPGEPIRCRCWAEPKLPDLDDLDGLIVH
ncbi:phage minor head protein [Cupriavidus alkaliphilus]|uniref:phage minor head protein n=1 Tax=Cupriavidus alkaliphilus TaxID=942866 RepID=UPI001614DFF7|nr:phage minor head protein [Cupriavidus alkaliphilus]MBB2918323.1 SPP1 gp7 family putative phage head morphogenesis protein [Cupriavidus alkaliphilus]